MPICILNPSGVQQKVKKSFLGIPNQNLYYLGLEFKFTLSTIYVEE